MAIVRTVLGDIAPQNLGTCYSHEHLLGHPPPDLARADLMLDNEEAAHCELRWFQQAGGQALVEMSTEDYGRNALGLRRLAERTGVHIVCATGFNKDVFSERIGGHETVDSLAARFTREIQHGIEDTGVQAGVIKGSSTLNAISKHAEKVFMAVAQAHHTTGAPISTHTEAGTMAVAQIELLEREGVDAQHVILGHLDRKLDWPYIAEVAATGAYFSFDQISKEKYYPDRTRIEFILRLVDKGHGKQLLLAGDLAKRSYWPGYRSGGGPGFTYILWRFVPWLREAGLSDNNIQDLLIHNPARVLAFSPSIHENQHHPGLLTNG